jgi:hypothetical protein
MEGVLMYELFNAKIIYQTPDDASYFFGYYDKPSLKDNKLLTHRVTFDGRDVRDGDVAEVGYIDLATQKFIKVDETLAWNWQQGSQLQWLDENRIIYNSIKDNRFVSIIYNLKTNEKKVIPFAIYTIHPNKKEALGINYERFYWVRPGYNYQNIKNEKFKGFVVDDGIFRIDLESGEVKKIIDIKEILEINRLKEFDTSYHWLEHMMYNPSGERFIFFHRWRNTKENTRLYSAKSDGTDIISFPDVRFYSHACWKSEREFSIWARDFESGVVEKFKQSNLRKILRPFYHLIKPMLPKKAIKSVGVRAKHYKMESRFAYFEDCFSDLLEVAKFGHQRWIGDNLLTDTYEDEENFRWLYFLDTKNQKLIPLAKFYSHYNKSGYRCDLHPRVNEKFITIDSSHTKKRKQVILEISDV